MTKIEKLVKFAKNHLPNQKKLQQDEQDFEDWIVCNPSCIFFSWPKGKQAHATVAVNAKDNTVVLRTKLTDGEELEELKEFVALMEIWIKHQTDPNTGG